MLSTILLEVAGNLGIGYGVAAFRSTRRMEMNSGLAQKRWS